MLLRLQVSGATASDANAVFAGDLFQFKDGVSGQPNMRYLTFIGHYPSANSVQFRATANAPANASGNVTISIYPPLNWAGGANQNLNNPVAAGMQLLAFPSPSLRRHLGRKCALHGNASITRTESTFDTANEYDPETAASLRLTYGSLFGQNQTGMIYDEVHGSVIVPEYSMRFLIPLSQG